MNKFIFFFGVFCILILIFSCIAGCASLNERLWPG